jgi:prepilin-type N-terminal cleavage/methylation domain-containing protein
MSRARPAAFRGSSGFGLAETLVVLAIISIVTAFAVVGVKRAMASIRLQNSVSQLGSRVESARIDAIRRHKSAVVEFTSSNSYSISMDFEGAGVELTRVYTLESGVTINSPAANLPVFDFDWRGRTPQCFTSITMQSDGGGGSSTLSVSSGGDVTINAGLSSNLNSGSYTTVSATGDVQKGVAVNGAGAPACLDPCGGCVASGGGPTLSTPPPGCVGFGVSKSAITIRKNYKSSDSFVVSVTANDTITAVQTDGRVNLEFLPSPTQPMGANSSKTFTVRSKGNTTGYFPVKFVSACNPANVAAATVRVSP